MGKPKQFYIAFNNNTGVFYGGQTVAGVLTLELEEPLSMRGLRLEYKGWSTVGWTEGNSAKSGQSYFDKEHYFNGKQGLWTKDKNGSDEMPKGLYTYPFSFDLPQGLPSSFEAGFEGGAGYVRYTIKGVIKRRFRSNITTKQPFSVIHDLDLNKQPDAMMEVTNRKHKFLCCLCCKSGPISATVRIPRKGYVPGEIIPVDSEIENLSSRTMAKTTVRFIQCISFRAQSQTRTATQNVAEIRHGEIGPGGSDQYHAERILVPAVPPSFLEGCSIIDIRYFLQVTVDPKGIAIDLKVPVEITIGSIPLQQVMEQYPTLLFPGSAPSLPPPPPHAAAAAAALPTRQELYSSLPSTSMAPPARPPPPTYSESVFGKVSVKEDGEEESDGEGKEEKGFAPVYTYYNWGFQNSTPQ